MLSWLFTPLFVFKLFYYLKDKMTDKVEELQEFVLEADAELRFEVENKNETVSVELKSGYAEIFGTELVKGKSYSFNTGAKLAIFTWQGCTLELKGKKNISYIARETPMMFYLNCHASLEQIRIKAETDKDVKRGPITMVVGPMDVGKSTVCKILLNYAVRMGRTPVFVDLDVGQGQIAVPGSIGAVLVERPATVEEGFSQQAPLVYHFGHSSPSKNIQTKNLLISKMSEVVHERLQANKKANVSGVLINTCGWVKGDGYKLLTHAAEAFEVDIILVLDQEKLYNELVRDMPNFVRVVLLPKSGGVVERTKKFRSEVRDSRVRQYFYGMRTPLHPHSFDVKWLDLKIYKVGAPPLPDSCMPLGMKAEDNMTKLVAVQPGPNLLHHLLAVSFAATTDDDIITTNIAGYICVTNVDVENQTLTVLSPQPRPLPDTLLILSEIQFMDSH